MSDQNDSNPATAEQKVVDYSGGPIVARSDPWYRMKQSVVVLICLAAGIWCLYDGFWKFPRENDTAIRRGQRPPLSREPRSDHQDVVPGAHGRGSGRAWASESSTARSYSQVRVR